jgi:hypothetical protein
VKKGEITLVHREQALKAYEQEVQKQINTYLQNENALQERMNRMMDKSIETTLTNHSSEFSTPYIPGETTQVFCGATVPTKKHTNRSVEYNIRNNIFSLTCS